MNRIDEVTVVVDGNVGNGPKETAVECWQGATLDVWCRPVVSRVASRSLTKLLAKSGRRRGNSLVSFTALLLMRKSCLVLISPSLQRPHYKLAAAFCFLSQFSFS